MISRNHSNVSKPAFVISQVLYYSSRNQLTFLFYCLLWNKTKKNASHLFIPSITQQTQPFPGEFVESPSARFRPLSILPRKTQKKKHEGTTGESLYPVGGTGWDGIWILSQITQNPLRLAKNTHIVLRTTPTRLWLAIQAANYRGNCWQSYIRGSLSLEIPSFVLVEFRLEFIVNLVQRKTRFWFITVVRGDPVCRKKDCSQYDIGLVFKETSSYSDQDKLKFIENVWKSGELFDFPVSASGMFEF